MVFVDTDQLRELGARLDLISDTFVPGLMTSPLGSGAAEVVLACTRFEQTRAQTQLMVAGQVRALAMTATLAAWQWERAEAALSRL